MLTLFAVRDGTLETSPGNSSSSEAISTDWGTDVDCFVASGFPFHYELPMEKKVP